MSEIIGPRDYTPEIRRAIEKLEYRMAYTLTDYKPGDIAAFRDGDTVYVLANPVLGKEPIYDDFGQVIEYLSMHNITLIYYDGPPEVGSPEHDFKLSIRLPRLRILRPDLCLRIENGEVTDCGPIDLESLITNRWMEQIEDLISGIRRITSVDKSLPL